jgi:DNA-binding ferritin-like protein
MFVQAEERGEHGLSNFLADRQDAFAKHAWFLRATAKV